LHNYPKKNNEKQKLKKKELIEAACSECAKNIEILPKMWVGIFLFVCSMNLPLLLICCHSKLHEFTNTIPMFFIVNVAN
jgi:hypothetical protein